VKRRKKEKRIFEPAVSRGYVHLYIQHVGQANEGADFDFLRGGSGSEVTRDSH